MNQYRAYRLDADGHIVGFESIACADDGEAIEQAKRLIDGCDIELWSGHRFVGLCRISSQITPAGLAGRS
jgi:hypothetical protein